MDFALSTRLFADDRLNSHCLDPILRAGFRQIEVFAARQHLDYCDQNQVRDVAQWFADHAVVLHSVHAPLFGDTAWGRDGGLPISLAYLERRHRIDSMDEVKRALEIAERLPFRYLVVHLGLAGESYDLRKFDAAFTSLEHLCIFAKDRGVSLLLENTPNELSTPARLVQFIEYTRLNARICFDTGHAHMGDGVAPAFATLKDRVALTHVHDNHRVKDEHLLPFEGEIDWTETVRAFRSAEGQFPVLFEPQHTSTPLNVLSRLHEVMERLDKVPQEDARD
jgi:sugar phosphate isomerase/epimerase